MKATVLYESAVYLAWLAGMGLIYLWAKLFPKQWPVITKPFYEKPGKELFLSLLPCLAVIGLSVLSYRYGKLFQSVIGNRQLAYLLQILIIYSPLFIYLLLTGQKTMTCYLSIAKIGYKAGIGLFAALVSGYIFISINGAGSFADYLRYIASNALSAGRIQTFLEGVAVGFLVYRLFALLNKYIATILVAVLFMLSHFQNYTQGMGFSTTEAGILILAHTGITCIILLFVYETQDIISVFFIHWFINAASSFLS